MSFELQKLVRENIKNLEPYSSARKEFSGVANIFLDANENSFGSPIQQNFHRYPDSFQLKIKKKIADINEVRSDIIFVGNGSDEAIDLLFRIFCEPKTDNIIICPPTYGMYKVSAGINDVATKSANLTADFNLDLNAIERETDQNTKLIFVCSPNNPTGNSLQRNAVLQLIENFNGIVVVDEAYVHFSDDASFVSEIRNFENLVVLQTFSKAWGLAGLRVGLAFANKEIIKLFNKVKPPYNVSEIAQSAILKALSNKNEMDASVAEIINEREKLIEDLSKLETVKKIYPTDANFVLVKTLEPNEIYRRLTEDGIVVRNRDNVEMCEGCLRITIGTPKENKNLINALKKISKQ